MQWTAVCIPIHARMSPSQTKWGGQNRWSVGKGIPSQSGSGDRQCPSPSHNHYLKSADLHQSQEHPLDKVGWTCSPQSTSWRRSCVHVRGNAGNKLWAAERRLSLGREPFIDLIQLALSAHLLVRCTRRSTCDNPGVGGHDRWQQTRNQWVALARLSR